MLALYADLDELMKVLKLYELSLRHHRSERTQSRRPRVWQVVQ